jgi:hypothetical protein
MIGGLKMKFKLINIISAISVISALSLSSSIITAEQTITLSVDGNEVEPDVPPQIIDGRTMVPIRAMFESIGARVIYDPEDKTIVAIKNDKVVTMTIDNEFIDINGNKTEMDCPPVIINGRALAPARYSAEAFDYDVSWDAENKIVQILQRPETTTETTTESTTEETTQSTTKITTTETTTQTTSETTTQIVTSSFYGDIPVCGAGIYKVGTDIDPGQYRLVSDSSNGYYCIGSDPMCNSVIDNDNFGTYGVIELVSGEYVKLSRCNAYKLKNSIKVNPLDKGYVHGSFLVGCYDIPKGTHRIEAASEGYYCIYDRVGGSIVTNDHFTGTVTVEVEDDQVLTVNRARVTR